MTESLASDLARTITMDAWELLRATLPADGLATLDGEVLYRDFVEIGMHYGIAAAFRHFMANTE